MSGKKVVGIVLFTKSKDGIKYLMLEGLTDDKEHGPPKGQFTEKDGSFDNLEDLKICAIKHTQRKTPYTTDHFTILRHMPSFRQKMRTEGNVKEVAYFLAELNGFELRTFQRHSNAKSEWLDKAKAKERYEFRVADHGGFDHMLDQCESYIFNKQMNKWNNFPCNR